MAPLHPALLFLFLGFTLSHSFATPKSSWVCKAAGAPRVSLRVFAQNLPGTPSPQSQAGRGALKCTSHCLALQMQELCNSLGWYMGTVSSLTFGFCEVFVLAAAGIPKSWDSPQKLGQLCHPAEELQLDLHLGKKSPSLERYLTGTVPARDDIPHPGSCLKTCPTGLYE